MAAVPRRAWDIRLVYLYLVVFVTLIVLIVAGTGIVRAVADIFLPGGDHPPDALPRPVPGVGPWEPGRPAPDPELAQAQREHETARAAAFRRAQGTRRVADGLATVAVALPVYLYHWRRIRASEPGD